MRQTFLLEPRLNRVDALYCFLEGLPRCNVSMCMAAILEREVAEDVVRAAMERVVSEVSRCEDRLRPVPGGLAPPVWVHAGVDPERQLRFTRLREGAGWDDVLRALDRRHSAPFPDGAPPWQVECVYGVPDGRMLAILKLHHAFADGSAIVAVLSNLLMREILAQSGVEIATERAPEAGGTAREALRHWRRQARDAAQHAGELLRGEDRAARASRELGELRDYARGVVRNRATRSSAGRASALFRIPLERWKAVAEERGGAVNDLYLAVAAAGVRRAGAAARRDRRRAPLRVAMPVNARDGGILQPVGNVTGTAILQLDGSEETLRDLASVRRVAHRELDRALAAGPSLVDDVLALLPGGMQARATARRYANTDVMATNLIVPLVCGLEGATAEMVFLIPPVIGPPVSFALGGYDERLHLAMTADTGLVRSPERAAHAVGGLLEELLGAEHVERFAR
jgi:diacylglycerol O-acyltransferase / wax synthase